MLALHNIFSQLSQGTESFTHDLYKHSFYGQRRTLPLVVVSLEAVEYFLIFVVALVVVVLIVVNSLPKDQRHC